jgi:hypothetical protein
MQIHPYDYKQTFKIKKGILALGCELEIESKTVQDLDLDYDEEAEAVEKIVKKFDPYFSSDAILKHDGSLNCGAELVTRPMSFREQQAFWTPEKFEFLEKEGFISCSPYGMDLINVHVPMDTEPLSTSFPFVSFDLSSSEGILYGINRHNNSLVLFDISLIFNYEGTDIKNKIHQLFSLMNPNKGLTIIFAPDSINSEVISDLLLNLDKKIELSVAGFYNDISNTYIDNSILCFEW